MVTQLTSNTADDLEWPI